MQELAKRARKRLLQMHFEAGVGHIGGNLSAMDAMLVLHHQIMRPEDVFILSKGHAAGALYTTLWTQGKLTDEDLKTFHKDGTHLAGHPAMGWSPDIPFATGSLGHGLSDAAGMALGYKLQGLDRHVYCLTSDGEWQEGSTWEALIFAVQNKLTNLTIVIDENHLQGFGATADIASDMPLKCKLRGFGAWLEQVNGHDYEAVRQALQTQSLYQVRIVLLDTMKGCGVSFMENKMEWHYLPLNAEQYQAALKELS
jgi:transketolase